MEEIDIKHILKWHAYRNMPLSYEEAYDLGVYAIESCQNGNFLAQIQSISCLCALHTKSTYKWQKKKGEKHKHRLPINSSEQIAGICAAVFQKDIAKSKCGFLHPRIKYAMDNCGMGGDNIVTANVSTLSAFIAASVDIPILKHGSPANADQGRHGSSDFVSLCGIETMASKKQVEKSLETCGFGYTDALDTKYKHIHTQTHKIAMLPHMNDILGPITNPLDPQLLTRRVLGVNHLINPKTVAKAYLILNDKGITNMQHALFIRGLVGNEGIDELSICKEGTMVAELKNGKISEYMLYPKDFGLKPISHFSVSPPKNMSKGEFSLKILKGEIIGPPMQMVLANSTLLLYLGKKSDDLKECYVIAKNAHEDGKAYKKMLSVSKNLPNLRGSLQFPLLFLINYL